MHTLLTIHKFKVKEMIRSACSYLFYSVVFTEKVSSSTFTVQLRWTLVQRRAY